MTSITGRTSDMNICPTTTWTQSLEGLLTRAFILPPLGLNWWEGDRPTIWARFHERSDLCDLGSLLTQDRLTRRFKIVSTIVGSVRVKRPIGSILVLIVVRGPGIPNKEIASFPIWFSRIPSPETHVFQWVKRHSAAGQKMNISPMNEDVSNPTLFGGSSGEYMDSLGSVYNSSGHCSSPHTSPQTTLEHSQSFSNCHV